MEDARETKTMKLKEDFYLRTDVVRIAKDLLGKYLITNIDGKKCVGLITETEAYEGVTDKASHAYGGRRTDRTEVMFGRGGVSYVYLCYGIHHLFNVVTNYAESPHAVLIRGVLPIEGQEWMCERTKKAKANKAISDGPGKLTKAFGINMELNKVSLLANDIWIEDRNFKVLPNKILISKRIGIDYAEEDADLLYRFNLLTT